MLTKIPKHNFNKNYCQGARASDKNNKSPVLTSDQSWIWFSASLRSSSATHPCCFHIRSDCGTCLSAPQTGCCLSWLQPFSEPCHGEGYTGLHSWQCRHQDHHGDGRCCGQTPRPLSVVAEMRVSSCSRCRENHSTNDLGTWLSLPLTKWCSDHSLSDEATLLRMVESLCYVLSF